MDDKRILFKMTDEMQPKGDQPQAINALVNGLHKGMRDQVLLGVTGSGKTFTMANVIARAQRPALIIAHNKTLAAQLCEEFRDIFPDSAVGYFVSYYDYYQPEAYIASTDTFIEKDSSINDEIDRLRHSATAWLSERRDVIIVASVSCIYGLGDPREYEELAVSLREGMAIRRNELLRRLVDIQYDRNEFELDRGAFRVRGDVVEIFPTSFDNAAYRVEFFGDEIERICEIDVTTGKAQKYYKHIMIFPASHYATGREKLEGAMHDIEEDLRSQLNVFHDENKLIEEQRLSQRTQYDLEMMREIGYCNGIENYSRYFDERKPGEPPFTLLDYFPKDFLVFIDESHATIPQIRAMYAGDRSRKTELVNYGFRLPAALDNRPLMFAEFEERVGQCIYVSATPAPYELSRASQIVEQIIRPTGLCDPQVVVKPATGQVEDLLGEIRTTVEAGYRVMITALTKRMSENLTTWLNEMDVRVRYLHSDVETLERIKLLKELRQGEYDVLVGVNLLREGLDLPEVALVAILDADKEGFLRSETSLIQTIGRAARNIDGRVILYADGLTNSMIRAINETNRRRAIQNAYNVQNNITPTSIKKAIHAVMEITRDARDAIVENSEDALENLEAATLIEEEMLKASMDLDFERAAQLRDRLYKLQGKDVKGNAIQKKSSRRRKKYK